jgi:hypothetical protein
MKKNSYRGPGAINKIALRRETIARLTIDQLGGARGGAPSPVDSWWVSCDAGTCSNPCQPL